MPDLEVAGAPDHFRSSFVNGIKRLPVRVGAERVQAERDPLRRGERRRDRVEPGVPDDGAEPVEKAGREAGGGGFGHGADARARRT